MATIKDVAKKAGVSISTASYAINGHSNVSEKTRKKILDAAKELEYYPNANARNLKTNKTRNVGFFIYGFDGPIFGDILEGVNAELQKTNYNIIVSSGNSSSVILKERQVDAAIIFDSNLEDEVIENYSKKNLVVLLDRMLEGKNIFVSKIQNKEIVEKFALKIAGESYKKIAYLSGPSDSPSNIERESAFIAKLNSLNIDLFKKYHGDFTIETGYKLGLEIAKETNKPDFIFAANDESAIGLINALKDSKVKVPEEISVVGFDGILLGEYIEPKLSTVKIDYKKWGYDLAKFVLCFLEKDCNIKVKNPEYEINFKESTK